MNEKKNMDVEGFEPSTSRMQSVRATTVPNAHTYRIIYSADIALWGNMD